MPQLCSLAGSARSSTQLGTWPSIVSISCCVDFDTIDWPSSSPRVVAVGDVLCHSIPRHIEIAEPVDVPPRFIFLEKVSGNSPLLMSLSGRYARESVMGLGQRRRSAKLINRSKVEEVATANV